MIKQITKPLVSMRNSNNEQSRQINQCFFGEKIKLIKSTDQWDYIELVFDGYQGWIKSKCIESYIEPTHLISKNNTLLYMEPNSKSLGLGFLPMGANIKIKSKNNHWIEIFLNNNFKYESAFLLNNNTVEINGKIDDWVKTAQSFLNTPYLWGGRSYQGIDCSALLQISLKSSGFFFPRDTNLQMLYSTSKINDDSIKRGTLIFCDGHVGVMINENLLLHANGHHMKVSIEDLNIVKKRIHSKILMTLNL